jgi:hypothetical protein
VGKVDLGYLVTRAMDACVSSYALFRINISQNQFNESDYWNIYTIRIQKYILLGELERFVWFEISSNIAIVLANKAFLMNQTKTK